MNNIERAYQELVEEREGHLARVRWLEAAIEALKPLLPAPAVQSSRSLVTTAAPVATLRTGLDDGPELPARMPDGVVQRRSVKPGYVDKTAAGPSLKDVIARGARRTYGLPVEDIPAGRVGPVDVVAAVDARCERLIAVFQRNGRVATLAQLRTLVPREAGHSDVQHTTAIKNTLQRLRMLGKVGRTGDTWSLPAES